MTLNLQTDTNDKHATGLRNWLLELPRYYKRTLLVLSDLAILSAVVWSAMAIRYEELYVPSTWPETLLVVGAPVLTVVTFFWLELYRLVTRFMGPRGYLRIFAGVGLSVLVWALVVFMTGQHGIPRTVILTYALLSAVAITASRQAMGYLLKRMGVTIPHLAMNTERRPVLIYGAGQMGAQLAQALRRGYDYDAVGFIDPEPSMWGQYVGGLKVYRPEKLDTLITRAGVKEVLVAIPEAKRRERRQIHSHLERYPVVIKVLPDIQEIASGRVRISDVRPIDVHDLLGRDPVPPNVELLAHAIRNKSILITGAGGSVGSELVRQILKQEPSRIVLFDVSEAALYRIELEISERIARKKGASSVPALVAVLGSVLDEDVVRHTISTFDVQTIYHAAAYKHVPIVEKNAFVGLNNNTFGCAVIAEASRELGVERVVLISTDKAVRPTNVMGASKRLAELVLQAHASEEGISTIFTMVRFGNVLDSSGSVVGRFRDQIETGGPVTVTHAEVIRYFMSIPEAAELVIQAGSMATGGEVFVLDMGEPVKIDDLARLMIRLAGFEVRDEDNPEGDLEITYTGLRPGEKLYEELLIGSNTRGTDHPRIMRSGEPFLPVAELAQELEILHQAIKSRDLDGVHTVLQRTVEGYNPPSQITPTKVADPVPVFPATPRTLH